MDEKKKNTRGSCVLPCSFCPNNLGNIYKMIVGIYICTLRDMSFQKGLKLDVKFFPFRECIIKNWCSPAKPSPSSMKGKVGVIRFGPHHVMNL